MSNLVVLCHLMTFWRRNLTWILTVFACLILSVAAIYHLSESPAIWYDEGYYTQVAMNLAETGKQALQLAPSRFISTAFVTVGYPLIFPVSVSYRLYGVGVMQGRAAAVLFVFGFAAVAYVFVRKLFGAWTAAWSLLLLVSLPMFYGIGKSVLGEVSGLFYLVLSLLSLWYLERSHYRDWRGYLAVSVTAGLCAATKPIFLLFLGALFLTLVVRWRSISLRWGWVVLGSIALFAPILLWVFMQFGFGDSVSSVLSAYANPYAVVDLKSTILHNALRFFTETTPMYTTMLMTIWGWSLLLKRRYKEASSAELAAFVFCILIILAYLRIEGWYRYFFPATMIALLFFPNACVTVFHWCSDRISVLRRAPWLPYVFFSVLIIAQLYQLAFTSFVAGYYASTRTHDLSAQIETYASTTSFFLYNIPEIAVLLPSRNYYQYLEPIEHVVLGGNNVPSPQEGLADVVIVDDGVYQLKQELFSSYSLKASVNRYDFLEKNQ